VTQYVGSTGLDQWRYWTAEHDIVARYIGNSILDRCWYQMAAHDIVDSTLEAVDWTGGGTGWQCTT